MGPAERTNPIPEHEVLAVGGKGGAGKTTFAAIGAKILSATGRKILAIDADPPVSLTFALGGKPLKTVGDMRHRLIEDPREKRKFGDRHMRDILRDEVLLRLHGMDLLVSGRGEEPGCYCSLNQLLKFGIESLSKEYEVTLIDCEAGIEQINRLVIDSIRTLVIISDATLKGIQTAVYLKEIAEKYGVKGPHRTGLVINRADAGVKGLEEKAREMGLDVLGIVPVDANVAEYDRVGRPTVDLPDDSSSVIAVRRVLADLGLLT
jgi:CO dehydrogenase maturation factor